MRERIAAWAAEKSAVPEGSANLIADPYIAKERARRRWWAVFRTRMHIRMQVYRRASVPIIVRL